MAGIAGFFFTPSSSTLSTSHSTKLLPSLQSQFSSISFRTTGGGLRSLNNNTLVARYGRGGYRPKRRTGGRRGRSEQDPDDANYDPLVDIDRIESDTVRLLDQEKNMIGVVSTDEASQMAEDKGLILVILSPDADPPVLRLFDIKDYEKFTFEKARKKSLQQKKSIAKRADLKELKMGYRIDSHDYSVRMRAAKKFLTDGDKVKVIITLKGRQNAFRKDAIELLKRFQNDVGELAVLETRNLKERQMYMVLMPNKAFFQRNLQRNQEQAKKKEEKGEDGEDEEEEELPVEDGEYEEEEEEEFPVEASDEEEEELPVEVPASV